MDKNQTELTPSCSPQPSPAPAAPSNPDPQSASLTLSPAPIAALQSRVPKPKTRNGKIARLPKLQREMVNRMLQNNVSHERIADALLSHGAYVTPRNISNWKTRGGYKEWCAQQEASLELRLFQDNLVGFLRREDAAELAETGLQAASTAISAGLLRPEAIREMMSNPEKFVPALNLLSRLNKDIQAQQKYRDDLAKSLGADCHPERVKRLRQKQAERLRECYSYEEFPTSKNDPGLQHHNYIPTDLPPAPPQYHRPAPEQILNLWKDVLVSRKETPPPPNQPSPGQPAADSSNSKPL